MTDERAILALGRYYCVTEATRRLIFHVIAAEPGSLPEEQLHTTDTTLCWFLKLSWLRFYRVIIASDSD